MPDPNLLPKSLEYFPNVFIHSVSSVGAYDILRAQEIVMDKLAVEWLIGKTRQTVEVKVSRQYDGNAMVMRRRSLGLSDFPAEGEVDESKEMLRRLEGEVAQAGGVGGQSGVGQQELEEVNELGDIVEEAVETVPEDELTEKEHEEIEKDANRLVEGLS